MIGLHCDDGYDSGGEQGGPLILRLCLPGAAAHANCNPICCRLLKDAVRFLSSSPPPHSFHVIQCLSVFISSNDPNISTIYLLASLAVHRIPYFYQVGPTSQQKGQKEMRVDKFWMWIRDVAIITHTKISLTHSFVGVRCR